MTNEQERLILAIDTQRQLVSTYPGDNVEELVLDALYAELRRTFRLISATPEKYVYSPSRAVLKRVQ